MGFSGVLSGLSGLSGFWWGLRLLVFLEVREKGVEPEMITKGLIFYF